MATRALTALFLCITYSIAIKGQTVEIEPKEQIVLPGSNVSVLCRVAYEIDFCRIEIPGLKSYVLKSDTTPINGIGYYGKGLKYGECGVSIDHVSEANNGDVRCSVSPPPGSIEEMSNTMKLVIAKAPAYPILDFNRGSAGPSSYKIGDILNVRCTVADGRPAASIEWYLDDQPLLYGLQQPVTYQAANSDLMTFSQNLSRRLEMGDNGRTIRCFSIHRAVPPNTAAILQINVNYPPAPLEDPIKIFGIKIGETGLVNITIVAEPMPQLEWRLSGETLRGGDVDSTGRFEATEALQLGNGTYNATLRISSVTREDTEKEYILKAYNDQGLQEYRIQISTMDEPEGVELGAGAIIGIVIAVLVVLIAVFLVIFAKATNRWCFGDGAITLSGKSRNTGESSDTESADASHLSRRNEAEVQTGAQTDLKEVHLELKGQQSDAKSPGAIARALAIPRSINIRALLPSKKNKNDSPENKATDEAKPLQQRVEPTEAGLIYAELSLSPVNQEKDNKPAVEPTEYAEIIYNQQPVENTLDKESKDVK